MDDRDFFDTLLQTWAQTFGAENMYWKVVEVEAGAFTYTYEVYAVDAEQGEHFIGSFLSEADADFVAGIHGCLPDLVRRLHAALDESDRLDLEMDQVQNDYAGTQLRLMEVEQALKEK